MGVAALKKIFLIVNPKSGKLKGKDALFDIINTMSNNNCIVTIKITEKCGDAMNYAKSACDSGIFDRIICCGGDGTLSETVAGVLRSENKTPVGYIPCGSTNDYAKSIGLSSDIAEAAKYACTKEASEIDIGKIDKRYFNYIASFGAFTQASYNAPQSLKNMLGHMAYVLEGIKDLTKIKAVNMKIKTESGSTEGDYIFGAVANSTSIGGIVKLSDLIVSLNDGEFEVCLVKNPSNPADLVRIIRGALSADFSSPCFEFFKTKSIEFEVPENMPWSLDGEKYVSGSNVNISVIPRAVKLVL